LELPNARAERALKVLADMCIASGPIPYVLNMYRMSVINWSTMPLVIVKTAPSELTQYPVPSAQDW
jgi:hypothetical protein